WIAGCLWYRVEQVPNEGEPFAVGAYLMSTPTASGNEAGRLLRQAAQDLVRQETAARATFWTTRNEFVFQAKAAGVLQGGSLKADSELGRYLTLMFAGDWVKHLRTTEALPIGVVDLDESAATWATLQALEQAQFLLQLHALQQLEEEKQEAALDDAF